MGSLVVDQARTMSSLRSSLDPQPVCSIAISLCLRSGTPSRTCLGQGRDFEEEKWNATQYPLSQGVQSAIIVNVLTEDNLPYYTHTLMSPIKPGHPLRDWSGAGPPRSGAIRPPFGIGSSRHGDRSLPVGGRPDGSDVKGQVPRATASRDDLLCELSGARHPGCPSQHWPGLDKTMRGKKIMSKVAGDEGLHHAFYRDLVSRPSR